MIGARLLLLVAGCILLACALDPTLYPHSQQLLPKYTVYWRVDEDNGVIYLALQVQTKGWVGFGLAEPSSGSMPGADIVIGTVISGVGSVSDHWASEFNTPAKDGCQDWVLVGSNETGDFTTIEIMRALDTKDDQDRAILPGPTRVIAAFGDIDLFGYHGNNRITSEIIFYGESPIPPLPSDAQFIELLMKNFTVPDGVTHYACQSIALPVDQDYHIVRIEPLIQKENIGHVHHYLVHMCENVTNGYVTRYNTPGVCNSPIGVQGCAGMIAGWAAGGGPAILPPQAGFRMGSKSTSAHFLVLEIHYNNIDGQGGYVDTSGAKIWYTNQIRQYDAGVITLGDPFVNLDVIPPLSMSEFELECPSRCTSAFPHEITVFQSFPHMHQIGSEIWTSQWRNDTLVRQIGRVEYWSFDHQLSELLNITIEPGDRLNTHCVYDTSTKTTPTPFGLGSADEMCQHYISYYPRFLPDNVTLFSYCGYYTPNITVCGGAGRKSLVQYNNPSVHDPPGGSNRTFGRDQVECHPTPPLPDTAGVDRIQGYISFILATAIALMLML